MLLRYIFIVIAKIFNNALGQKILETAAKGVLRLLGIGNGAGVNMSGELSAVRGVLNQNQNGQYVIFDVGANKGQFREMANSCLEEQISEKNLNSNFGCNYGCGIFILKKQGDESHHVDI